MSGTTFVPAPEVTSPPPRRSRLPSPRLLAVIAVAWAVGIVVEVTGRGGWLHHHELLGASRPAVWTVVLFLMAWQVHVAAMMLPSSLPLSIAVGIANMAWLAPLTLVMVVERSAPWGAGPRRSGSDW